MSNKLSEEALERIDEWFDAWMRKNENPNKRKSHIYTLQQIRARLKKPKITREFVGMLRDRLMAIPIREYFIPNRRKVIADRITEEFIKNGVELE